MKASVMAGSALVVSVGFHLAGFTMVPSFEIQIEGGAPMQLAMLGNSFADMAEGTISPVETKEIAEKVDDHTPTETQPAEVKQPVSPTDQAPTPRLTIATPVGAENSSNPVVPVMAAMPHTLAPLAPIKPLAVLKSEAPVEVQQAEPETRRPATRPEKPTVTRPKPVTPRRKQAAATPRKPQGGNQASRAGQSTGSAAGTVTKSGQGTAKARAAGNAKASNYPGLVMRKISRIRKQRAGARGKATVGFKITASGAATSVRILRSSGSAKVDQTALRHIKRASPFPRPPKGARRSFSVLFVSKR